MTSVQSHYSTKSNTLRSETGREGPRSRALWSTAGSALASEGAGGLSTAHIPPEDSFSEGFQEPPPTNRGVTLGKNRLSPATFEIWRGASRIKVSHQKAIIPQKGGGGRGSVTQFSRQSRKRLLDLLSMIDKKQKPVFLTLTYPGEFTTSSRVWKNDLEKFYKRMKRRFSGASMIWKLEPQKRGAPHYHLFVWGLSYRELILFAGRAWYEVVGSGDLRHLRAGTSVELVRSWRGVRSYASKYMGKIFDAPTMQDAGWNQPGRFWGVKGRDSLPEVVAEILQIGTEKQVFEILRLMRRYSGVKARKYRSLSILCNSPEQWERVLQL